MMYEQVGPCSNTVDFRLLVPLREVNSQTDQSNVSFTEMSSSMASSIGQFGPSPFRTMERAA